MSDESHTNRPTLSSGYFTLKAKQIQPDDGLKRAEICSCIIYCTIECNKMLLCFDC